MLGEYLVVRRLGAGGLGCVYLALQQPIGLPAAVKLLHVESGPLAQPERFRQEAAALARVAHPNIVGLLKYGIEDGLRYIVMELVAGGRTLADELRVEVSIAVGRRILLQICHALEAAHRRGVVHRDIKPSNIMLEAIPGETHFVRVVDFGLAKFVDEGDSTQLAAGTPRYMAPEQALRNEIGPWTDVYAVTVIACRVLLAHDPFAGQSKQSIILQKCDPTFDPLASLPQPVGPAVAALLRGGLARLPAHRIQDAPSLGSAIDAACDELERGEGASAPGPPQPPRRGASPPAGRGWWPWVAAAAGTLSGAAWLIGADGPTPPEPRVPSAVLTDSVPDGGSARPPPGRDAEADPADAGIRGGVTDRGTEGSRDAARRGPHAGGAPDDGVRDASPPRAVVERRAEERRVDERRTRPKQPERRPRPAPLSEVVAVQRSGGSSEATAATSADGRSPQGSVSPTPMDRGSPPVDADDDGVAQNPSEAELVEAMKDILR